MQMKQEVPRGWNYWKMRIFCKFIFLALMVYIFFGKGKPAWRNGLARWTSNPKVVGSTPTVGVLLQVKQ